MKKIQDMEIWWKWFEVRELTASESANCIHACDNRYTYSDIYNAYQKPSEAKVSIWNEWVSWAKDVNTFDDTYEVHDLRIGSANCFVFTVVAIIREFDEDEIGPHLPVATYIMRATKYHNYLYRLTSDENGEDLAICW